MTTTTIPLTPDTLAAIIAAEQITYIINDADAYRATIDDFSDLSTMIDALLHDMRDNIFTLEPIFFESMTDDAAIDAADAALLATLDDDRTHELIIAIIERAL